EGHLGVVIPAGGRQQAEQHYSPDQPDQVVDQGGERPPWEAHVVHGQRCSSIWTRLAMSPLPFSRSISKGRIPAPRAPITSSSGVSPTGSASSGAHPPSSSAALNIAGSGLAAPTSAEVTVPASFPSRPQSSSTLGSEQSQLETVISLRSRSAS